MARIDNMNHRETARAVATLSKEMREITASVTRNLKSNLEVDPLDLQLLVEYSEKIKKYATFWNDQRKAELGITEGSTNE